MIKQVLTEEQILELCLFKELNTVGGDEIAYKGVVSYVFSKNKNDTDENISEKVKELLVSYTLKTLTEKGVVDVDFSGDEPRYTVNKGYEPVQNTDS